MKNIFDSNCEIIDIGSRLELFVDKLLVSSMDNLKFQMHHPQKLPLAKSPLTGHFVTIIKENDLYRAYYRNMIPDYKGTRESGNPGELTCYAESHDGHEWTFPDLGLYKIEGMKNSNVILKKIPFSHNFTPFLDRNPNADEKERFKALAGHPGPEPELKADGLHSFASEDGIHWHKTNEKAVIPYNKSWPLAFDSQNVAFWSEAEEQYVVYFRTYIVRGNALWSESNDLRSISRATSQDFKHWSEPVEMKPNLREEDLYTSQTHPYFRAPHIYISLPTRYMRERDNSTDILFMSTRAGSESYERLFTEAFIKPGLDPKRWGNRSNYAALNVVPTGEDEISIYNGVSGYRYTLRTDGFVSIQAGAREGELLSKPFKFTGNKLVLNVSTSVAGGLKVEIQDKDGYSIPGFSLADCSEVVGDKINYIVDWKGKPELGQLADKAVRLRFAMKECDLYSFKFEC